MPSTARRPPSSERPVSEERTTPGVVVPESGRGPLAILLDVPRLTLIGLLKTYRAVISPVYGDVCKYFPSCSAYALEAVTVHGAARGTYLAGRRIIRCNPFSHGGIDHVPAGRRIWPEGRTPKIMVLNHPPIPADDEDDAASAARGA